MIRNCKVFTNNFTCKNCVYFHSQSCGSYVHSCDIYIFIQNCVHVEITYVFDTCKIDFFIITNVQ